MKYEKTMLEAKHMNCE